MNPTGTSHAILARPALRTQPDGRLVTLAREGSERALEEIVRRYRPALLRYAASIVPSDRADDVVQDSLARALPGLRSSDGELHLRAWLYTIVRNTALNNIRDAGPHHEQLDESYDGVEQPPQAIDRRERVRALVAGLQGLPAQQREALVKREMEGMSHSDIGLSLGVSAGAARQLIFRARNALREGLGALVPMPVIRYLVEGGTAVEAGAAGGGALALKATVAMLATGAAVTAGVAIKGSDHHRATTVAERAPATNPAGEATSRREGDAPGGGHRSAAAGPVNGGDATAPAPAGALGGDGLVASRGGRGSSPGLAAHPRGQDKLESATHHSGGSDSGSGPGVSGDGSPGSDDGPTATETSESDGESSSGGSSGETTGVESTTDGSDGSGGAISDPEATPEAQPEANSTDLASQSGTN